MSNRTPGKIPETLADFAQLANISAQSLEQILVKLNQAGIAIDDPHEKLSAQTKTKLLAFFRGGVETSSIRQTRISKLDSKSGSTKSVKITNISRKVASHTLQEQGSISSQALPDDESSIEPTTQSASQKPIEKVQKTTVLKKRVKSDPTVKVRKSYKNHAELLPEDESDFDVSEITVATSSVRQNKTQDNSPLAQKFKKPVKQTRQDIWIPERITLVELAKKMSVKDTDMMEHLEKIGVSLKDYFEAIDQETAILLVEEMGHTPRLLLHNAEEIALREELAQQMSESARRSPIVTIMGHVDHGKTSLLDYIRRTQVAAREKGGITQHIGAYQVTSPKGVITFLDTPGHAAFTAMRARGARLTDIVALVVAADDGVMPQTIEAIEHARAANVPIVVAINKMDKPGVTVEMAQQGLANYNLIPEDWGGETLFVPLSAKTGDGIADLLDALLLQAEIGELQAPTKGPAQGIIIESRLDKGQGPVATMIVQKGMLKKGDTLLAGGSIGRIRALYDAQGKSITSAGPATPVEVLGLSHPPTAGEEAIVVPNERKARELVQARLTASRAMQLQPSRSLDVLDAFTSQLKKSIPVVLKGDVQGSVEALKESLLKLSTEEITIKPLMAGVGAVTESDVNLALASKAVIFGFNVRVDTVAKRLIQKEKITVHNRAIIYELLEDAQKMLADFLGPQTKEVILGKAQVREIFKISKNSIIAGSIVTEGSITNHHNIRVIRDEAIVYQGKPSSLRRFKDDVKVVNTGLECGINIKNFTDIKLGDTIESYENVAIT